MKTSALTFKNRAMRVARWAIGISVFLVVLLLSFANADPVTLHLLLLGDWQVPLAVIVFLAFGMGTLFGLMAGVLRMMQMKRELKEAHKALTPDEMETPEKSDAMQTQDEEPSDKEPSDKETPTVSSG